MNAEICLSSHRAITFNISCVAFTVDWLRYAEPPLELEPDRDKQALWIHVLVGKRSLSSNWCVEGDFAIAISERMTRKITAAI
jgi:hypothetical protein